MIGAPEAGVAADHLRTVDAGGLILSAGRPVLLASSSYAPVKAESVLVAWKDTREARRAVIDAMPFLTAAREVVVATIEEADRREARESAADVVRFLMKHGAKARSEVIDVARGYAPDALVEIARERQSRPDRLRRLRPQPPSRVGLRRRDQVASANRIIASADLELSDHAANSQIARTGAFQIPALPASIGSTGRRAEQRDDMTTGFLGDAIELRVDRLSVNSFTLQRRHSAVCLPEA